MAFDTWAQTWSSTWGGSWTITGAAPAVFQPHYKLYKGKGVSIGPGVTDTRKSIGNQQVAEESDIE